MERRNLEQHEMFLSGLRVGVQSSCANTSDYIRRHWAGAKWPIVEADASCRIEVLSSDSPRIFVDGDLVWSGGAAEELVAGFELLLYRIALARHKGRSAVFHAAGLVSDGATFVFSGPSGAGKSSLALAAVRRGWKYFSDEFVVTDGERLWGWPRAIRFDPPEPGARCPDYLAGLDHDDDTLAAPGDGGAPYYAVSGDALQRAARPAHEVRFIRVARSTRTALEPLPPSVGLKHWTEASFFDPTMSLGDLVGPDRSWQASWRHPDELIDLLEEI